MKKANPRTKNIIIVTARGYKKRIDSIAVHLCDDAGASEYCGKINNLKPEDGGWITTLPVSSNQRYPLAILLPRFMECWMKYTGVAKIRLLRIFNDLFIALKRGDPTESKAMKGWFLKNSSAWLKELMKEEMKVIPPVSKNDGRDSRWYNFDRKWNDAAAPRKDEIIVLTAWGHGREVKCFSVGFFRNQEAVMYCRNTNALGQDGDAWVAARILNEHQRCITAFLPPENMMGIFLALDDCSLKHVLMSVAPKDLELALKGADKKIIKKALSLFTECALKLFKKEMAALGSVQPREIMEAQLTIIDFINYLVCNGEIRYTYPSFNPVFAFPIYSAMYCDPVNEFRMDSCEGIDFKTTP